MFLVRGHIFQDTRHTGTLCSHGDQAHPANPHEHQKQERVEQHSPGYQDQDPPAVADRQSWNGATCEVWNLNTGRAGTIDWVEWDTCHKCYHGTCVRMGQGGHRSIPVQWLWAGWGIGQIKLTLRKQDRTWGVEDDALVKKRTSPSERIRKRRQRKAAKRAKWYWDQMMQAVDPGEGKNFIIYREVMVIISQYVQF